MMRFSCMKAVYEHTPYLYGREKYYCTRHYGASPTFKKVSKPSKEIPDKEITVDAIRFVVLAVMKLACSVFAHKKRIDLACAL